MESSIVATVRLARAKSVKSVQTRRITMQPHGAPGTHIHNCPVVGIIESGSVTIKVGEGAEHILRAGDSFYEPAGIPIYAFDAGAEGAVFVAYFLLGANEEPSIGRPS